ncbi:MAG: PEP/pyruvate-binding domain-containing protein [Thermodesulfobacteriota bacterium]
MTASVLGLGEVGRGDVALAGGKGSNLGEMVRRGFPVPPGFVVTAEAYRAFFQGLGLGGLIEGLDRVSGVELEEHSRAVREAIERAEFPEDLAGKVLAAHDALAAVEGREMVFAVRSSATAEDLGEASFAGQHETYYYVGRDRLLRMISHCWASLFSPEAVGYRNTQGLDHAEVFMAVVVQEMVPSEVSGVTFTADPVTGDTDRIVTESSWGLGAAIVDGRVTPDHYVFRRKGLRLVEKRIGQKLCLVPPRPREGDQGRLEEVPPHLRLKETLSLEQARLVTEWALKAEEHFGGPQDVEWAITDGRFFLLQSRPITIMGREEIGRGVEDRYVLFKPIIENFTDPLTPLTQDLYSMAFAPPLMRFIGGRLYVSLRHVRAALPFKLTDEELAEIMYTGDLKGARVKVSPSRLVFSLGLLALLALVFGVFMGRVREMPDDFMDRYRDLCRRVDAQGGLDLVSVFLEVFTWRRLLQPVGEQVVLINFHSIRYFFLMAVLKKLVRRWAPGVRDDAEALLCSGVEGVLSAEMGRGVWALADEARRSDVVSRLLKETKPDKVLAALEAEPGAAGFLEALRRFLEVNGHRGLKELELRSARWEENPAPILGMVRNYLLVETDPAGHDRAMDKARAQVRSEIRERLDRLPFERTLKFRWAVLDRLARRIKYYSKLRENSRFYHIMGFYVIRRAVRRVEAELMRRGGLKCKDDVFFLRLPEIKVLLEGRLDRLEAEERIRRRRLEFVRLSKTQPPKTIGLTVAGLEPAQGPVTNDPEALRGQPASPGVYEGQAHVILDPSLDIELGPGEVLVAPYTDPAWTPLFLTAGAAVVEVGSYLSHAGTVAREFGLPCVVDVAECTRRIHTGVQVAVDGDHGLVRIVPGEGGEKK